MTAPLSLSGAPVQFNPGSGRPGTLSNGYANDALVYQQGVGGPWRLLQTENFGYSILSLDSPTSPSPVAYHDTRYEGIPALGDGQSYVFAGAVSSDGERVLLGLGGPIPTGMNTVVGSTNGGTGFNITGSFGNQNGIYASIQKSSSRYIAYVFYPTGNVVACDITTLPGSLSAGNFDSNAETTSWPTGYYSMIAGNYLAWWTGNTIEVRNISSPGSIGAITTLMPSTSITSTDFSGKIPRGFSIATDPSDATKLWVLVQLGANAGENSPSYGLISLSPSLVKTSGGPIWRIPSLTGETWTTSGAGCSLILNGGFLYAYLSAKRSLPSLSLKIYSTAIKDWSNINDTVIPGSFDVPPNVVSSFTDFSHRSGVLTTSTSSAYTYTPTGQAGWMFPLTCAVQSGPSPEPPPTPPPQNPPGAAATLLTQPSQFEPDPPGAPRPTNMTSPVVNTMYPYLSFGQKLFVYDIWGYQIVDITTRSNPRALFWEDYRTSPTNPGPFPLTGAGTKTIAISNVSVDGERAIFETSPDQVHTYHTAVGKPNPNGNGWTLAGDIGVTDATDVLIQRIGASYYAYLFSPGAIRVADITTLPGLAANNIATQTASSLPVTSSGDYRAIVSGHWVIYKHNANICLVNCAVPLPAANLVVKELTPTDFNRTGDTLFAYAASADPNNPETVYILGEFSTGVRYVLIKVTNGIVTVVNSLDVALGETSGFQNNFGVTSDGILFVLMSVKTSATKYKYYVSPAEAFGAYASSFEVTPQTGTFSNGKTSLVAGTNSGDMFAYVASGTAGWVFSFRVTYAPLGTPPGPPTSVKASKVNDTTASVSWTGPSNQGTTPVIDYFVVVHNTINGEQSDPYIVTAPTTTITINNLDPLVPYDFYIHARNVTGPGAVGISSVITLGEPAVPPVSGPTATPPGAPTNLAGIIGNTTIGLSWTTPATDGGSAITGYVISYKIAGNTPVYLNIGSVNNSNISALLPNTTYLVKIAAKNSVGVGPYSTEQSFTTSSYQLSYGLSSWPLFNGIEQRFEIEFANIPVQFNGLTALSRDTTTNTLYVSPDELYPAYEEIGKVTFRTAKRKKNLYTVGNTKNYYNPPGDTAVSANLQNLAANLNIVGLGFALSSYPDAGFLQDMLTYSARPGDIYTFYRKYQGYFSGFDVFKTDHGQSVDIEWKTNRETPGVTDPNLAIMPGWAYEYIHTRPFLRFDTRNLTTTVSIIKASISFKKDPNCPVVDPEKLVLKFVKVKDSVDSDNLTTSDYHNGIEGTVLATLPLADLDLNNGNLVTLPLSDISFIRPFDYSRMAMLISLEDGALPSDWTQLTLQEVSLNLFIDLSTVTTPGEVSFVTTDPADHSVLIEWGSPVIDGGSAVVSYTIKNLNNGEAKQILAEALVNNYSYEWEGLVNDVAYSFSITANNVKGEGQGTIFTAIPTAADTVPDAVRNLYGLPEDGKILVTWDSPLNSGSSPIIFYYVTNTNTGQILVAQPRESSVEFTGLVNGVVYTITAVAENSTGIGAGSTITVTPTSDQTVPARPNLTDVYATEGKATVFWTPPDSDGGNPIIGWVVTLEAPGISGYTPISFSIHNPDSRNFTINNIVTGNMYIVSVAATNSIGTGPFAFSDQFTVSSGVLTSGILVDVDYNYQKFYESPINLNIQSPQYLDSLYPETDEFYTIKTPAYVQSDPALPYPVIPSPSFRFIYLQKNTVDSPYIIDLLHQDTVTSIIEEAEKQGNAKSRHLDKGFSYTPENTAELINRYCVLKGINLFATALAGQRLSIQTIEEGDNVTLSLIETNTIASANRIVFGNNPFIAVGTKEYPVINHVPLPDYDATHEKALVESRPWTTVYNYDASRSSFYLKNFDTTLGINYNITIQGNIRPNSVSIQYFDINNKVVVLRDYLGDGRLLYRDKSSSGVGEPIIFSYPADSLYPLVNPSDGVSGFGNINYATGEITNLIFPTFTDATTGGLYKTFKPAFVLGKNVTWPIYVQRDSSIFLDINGVTSEFFIPKNSLTDASGVALSTDDATYTAEEIAAILNLQDSFRLAGLAAGVTSGQLYIQNVGIDADRNYPVNIGPTYTLSLTKNDSQFLTLEGNIKSCNTLLFGLTPIQSAPSKVYITYSYTTYNTSPYNHIWYQTPHFLLKSAGGATQFITKGHLNYLLDKLTLFKPAISTLDNIEFAPSFTDLSYINDTISVLPATDVEIPYIQVSSRPQVPTGTSGTTVAIKVINPDEQEGIGSDLIDDPTSYTYV